MCAVVKKMPYFSENCDYDRRPHKIIVALFLRIMIMIAVFIKCTIYENHDHGRSLHKNIIFLSLYVIAIMIPVLFISTVTIITVFIKTILYLSLYEDYEQDHILKRGLRPWPQCHRPHKMHYF